MKNSVLFEGAVLGRLELSNRLAVAPMTRISAHCDGVPSEMMLDYYARFAEGGFGLLITEGIYTDSARSAGYRDQPGLVSDDQVEGWREIVRAVHERGVPIIAQLMHAGALSQVFAPGETVGPSAIEPAGEQMAFYHGKGGYPKPRELTVPEIECIIEGFAVSAANAQRSGFDGVEVHGANGYLLDQFLRPHTNTRDDDFGGSLSNRMRLIEDIVHAVRRRCGKGFVIGLRLSQGKVNDYGHKWNGEAEAREIFGRVAELPLDYIHVTEFEAWQPAFADGERSLVTLAAEHSKMPVIANGSLHDPAKAALVVDDGASVIAIGRGALGDPSWPAHVRNCGAPIPFDPAILSPLATIKRT